MTRQRYLGFAVIVAVLAAALLSQHVRITRLETAAQLEVTRVAPAGRAPYLDVPAVVRRPNGPPSIYSPRRTGLRVTYTGNRFSVSAKDVLFVAMRRDDGDAWAINHVAELTSGDELELLSDELLDYGVSTLFVEAKKTATDQRGLLAYETLIGEMRPVELGAWDLEPLGDGWTIYDPMPSDPGEVARQAAALDGEYTETFAWVAEKGVHPLRAAKAVAAVLLDVVSEAPASPRRQLAVDRATRFFEWARGAAASNTDGAIMWPYEAPWPVHWGITIEPPWYSAYANGRMGFAAALLAHLSGDRQLETLARRAFDFVGGRIDRGGATYEIDGFVLPAEYVYPTPPLPNIRILDGELMTAIDTYNTAVVLGDSDLLRLAARYGASLAAQLSSYETEEGFLQNARYPWLVDDPTYLKAMQHAARTLAAIHKDRIFAEQARHWKLAPGVWP
ncbi:D-glucuronyl C5-epimerase family protein [Myxococcota bacterium]